MAGIDDAFPSTLLQATNAHWVLERDPNWRWLLDRLRDVEARTAQWSAIEEAANTMTERRSNPALAEVMRAYAKNRTAGTPETFRELVGLLNAIEAVPGYSPPLAAFIWRRARALPADLAPDERALLYARLHLHMRIADALLQAQAQTAPVEYTAWRSKAAPPPGWTPTATVPAELSTKAKEAFDKHGEIPWDRVTVKLAVRGDAANTTLVREGRKREYGVGTVITMQRLDVLHIETPTRLEGGEGLEIALAEGDVVTLDSLASRLDAAQRSKLEALVEQAAKDPAAEARVEAILPWVHEILRDVAKRPEHPTAAKAALWLVTLDE
jgi:hypothetical protein